MLQPEENRFTLFPIRHPDLFAFYKKQLSCDWNVEEVDTSKDRDDFIKLNLDEQYFIKNILGFFAASDEIVNENLANRFLQEVQCMEAQRNYRFQAMMEDKHSEMYVLLIDSILDDPDEKQQLYEASKNLPCVKQKADWARKWIGGLECDSTFSKRLVAFSIVEGIFFSGAFCAIYWLRSRNLMPGLIKSNEFIARDEGMHTNFAVMMYKKCVNKLSVDEIHGMIKDAVSIEDDFINHSLPCRLIGMNASKMTEYIRFVADRLIVDLGYPPIWNISKCPFDFLEMISMETKSNFFEERSTQYSKAYVENTISKDFSDLDEF
jgi:ribonucleoside-diphosphate reductase beta chain